MHATGHSINGYLELFRQRRLDLLARGQPVGYDKQVTTTWRLALDQLQQTAAQAAGLLRLLACCAPNAIPLTRLLQPRPRTRRAVRRDGGVCTSAAFWRTRWQQVTP